ncbi:MAG: nuclear transport factor 2 family protein [Brevirhabdus sp.]
MPCNHDLFQAIETYFDAIHECDTTKLNAVFHPESSLFDADNGTIFVEPIDSFSADVAGRTSPASVGQSREAEVLMIDYLSPISATVKIRIRAHKNVFVDHLGYVKDKTGWRIVSKIWHLERVVQD